MKNLTSLLLTAVFSVAGVAVSAQTEQAQDTVGTGKSQELQEVVVTGTLKEIRKSESPVPVTIISSKMFQRNPTSNVLDAICSENE
ncbi:hypothetical protein BCY91_10355 [Pelobium manganitolerans]|uniref:TonB-dependent receptor plug domain-containing protein n=1 Tax=Pelobium manganitolerans TaxID=1842495 RepID=A0A419S2J7_9SPHI|nr:hypothetical protein [Pelobium manganitolerans]RKD13215.1 hypothetical protein BCY91_10355 [Pelobium manganitolerans]